MAYADGVHGSASFPDPWQGSPNVNFVGCCEPYDAGAIRFDNSSASAVTIDDVSVDIGPYHYDLWGSGLAVPSGGSLILTSTANDNFDTSDTPGNCTPLGYVPEVHVTIGGATQTSKDTGLILNAGGNDGCGFFDGAHQWSAIGLPISGVTIVSAAATRTAHGVLVRWRTGVDAQTLGFNIYRMRGSKRVRLNRWLITTAHAASGNWYSFLDRAPPGRRAVRYWLQSVGLDGSRAWASEIVAPSTRPAQSQASASP